MGLDLARLPAADAPIIDSVRFGTYSSVHKFRKMLVLLTARHYLLAGQKEVADEAMALFPGDYPEEWAELLTNDTTLFGDASSLLDGENVYPVTEYVKNERLDGLCKFVNHSDCDGRHSRGDVADIAALFETVEQTAKETLGGEERSWFNDIGSFFLAARDGHEYITYC